MQVWPLGHVEVDEHVDEHHAGKGSGASYFPFPSVSRKIAFVTAYAGMGNQSGMSGGAVMTVFTTGMSEKAWAATSESWISPYGMSRETDRIRMSGEDVGIRLPSPSPIA